jgi:glutathione synthase/RimK-type ligase-like ATP-grasp enzyme
VSASLTHSAAPSIALVSARAARGLDEDMPPLLGALQDAGAEVLVADWDDAQVDWRAFDLALLRSTWDASIRLPEFLQWSERVHSLTQLLNPLPVIRWNTDKHYLAALAQAGVPTVPTAFIEPGQDAGKGAAAFLSLHESREVVVKPAVGSGSRDAQRHLVTERAAITEHIERLVQAGRSALIEPYLDLVDTHGETALIYFGGRFSHAIRKGPMLRLGEQPTENLFAAETITARTPTPQEIHVGEQALHAIPFGRLLYARVDLIRDAADRPCVLELELTEPSVFLVHEAGAAERFARAILDSILR